MQSGTTIRLLPFAITLWVCSGCAAHETATDAKSSDFIWVQVGTDRQGCALFTKKHTAPNIVVDSAIWYRDAQGRYVLDARSCTPETQNKVTHDE
jgi:hypothetical protein